jgi:hypothetical protein
VLGDLQSMCLKHDLFFFFCVLVLLLPLFLVGLISSLPQLAWDKRLLPLSHIECNFSFFRTN